MAANEGGKREMDYRVIRAQEDERKRLARDLHDGLVQSLVGIGINLEIVERHIEADPIRKPEALEILARVREGLAGCLEEARRILTDLRPLELGDRSLAQALKDYAERVSGEVGLKVTVVISGQETRLHPSVEAGLFRIFQEVLSNVREHAEAREVALKLRFLPRSVAMDVTDDGRGFEFDGDFQRLSRSHRFGLVGINERVRLLGGTWRVSSRPGCGTEVRVRVPIESRSGFWSFLPQRGQGRAASGQTKADNGPRRTAGEPATKLPGQRHPVRVLVADDHRVVREGLRMILDLAGGLTVAGEVEDGDEAVRCCRELSPDVVLLDLVMPGPGAVEVTRRIRRANPKTAVLVLTAHHDPDLVRDLMAAGAAGYLLKTADSAEIIDGIRAAVSGLHPLAPEAVRALSGDAEGAANGTGSGSGPGPAGSPERGPSGPGATRGAAPADLAGLAELTLREREVLALVGEGLTNHEIARRLYISDKTVRNHLGAVIRKMGLSDRTQVALVARGIRPAGRSGSRQAE